MKKYLDKINNVILNGKYKDTWDSLQQYRAPLWYEKAKFGIFIHWGIYSVPAFGSEWYSRNMYIQGSKEYKHHLKTYGKHKDFGYKDFIPMFKAENFDAGEWVKLFKDAGAQYVIPVAEHHDGFQMYDSDLEVVINYKHDAFAFGTAVVDIERGQFADASKAPNFHGIIRSVEVLGYDKSPKWIRDSMELKITTLLIESDKPVVFNRKR